MTLPQRTERSRFEARTRQTWNNVMGTAIESGSVRLDQTLLRRLLDCERAWTILAESKGDPPPEQTVVEQPDGTLALAVPTDDDEEDR